MKMRFSDVMGFARTKGRTHVEERVVEIPPEVEEKPKPRRTVGHDLTHALYSVPVLGTAVNYALRHKKQVTLIGSAAVILGAAGGYDIVATAPRTFDAYQQKWVKRIDSLKGVVAPWFIDGSIGNGNAQDGNGGNHGVVPLVIDLSTPTPIATSTPAIETPTPTPTILPVITEPIMVECRMCTPEEMGRYTLATKESYRRVADAFGMEHDASIVIYISEDKKTFGINFKPEPTLLVKYLTSWFENSPKAVDHELVHEFELQLLGTNSQLWYSEGLADYLSGRIPKGLDDAYDELLNNNYKWGEGRTLDAHTVGNLYFIGLIRNGLTTETNREALRILRRLRPSPTARQWTTPQLINLAYASALSKESQNLTYLLDLLEPGIVYNDYIR